MNWLRVSMTGQPGTFVMALTDWLVKPLRRSLPKSWRNSHVDWASVLAAALMALAYGVLVGLLFGVLGTIGEEGLDLARGFFLKLPVIAVKMLIRVALQTLFMLVLGYAILSWVQPGSMAYGLLARLSEPLLSPLRRVIPAIGGVDLSALVLLVMLQIGMMILV
jgi:YggT family protein